MSELYEYGELSWLYKIVKKENLKMDPKEYWLYKQGVTTSIV